MNDIVRVRHVRDYVCHVEFDDGSSGEIDLAAYLDKGPVFAALADIDAFKQVRIEGGTISWPNGADIAPEQIYEMVQIRISICPLTRRQLLRGRLGNIAGGCEAVATG